MNLLVLLQALDAAEPPVVLVDEEPAAGEGEDGRAQVVQTHPVEL
jgi:hypothetical protein